MPQDTDSSSLSSAVSDPNVYFAELQTARDRIAAYCPRSCTSTHNDYTTSLLTAILDNEKIIGRSGLTNVLYDIVHVTDLGRLAEHYMNCIFLPRIPPTIVEIGHD